MTGSLDVAALERTFREIVRRHEALRTTFKAVDGRPDNPAKVSFIDVDNVAGAYSAVRHMIQLGRKRIGMISGPLNTTVGLDRRQGYLNALNDRAMLMDEMLIVEGDFTEASGYTGMQRLLRH